MAVKWELAEGKRYLHVSFVGCTDTAQMLKVLNEQMEAMVKEGRTCLILSDYTGTTIGSDFMDEVKKYGKQHDALLGKIAVLGISGVKKILLQGYVLFTGQTNTKAFDTREEAVAWLLS